MPSAAEQIIASSQDAASRLARHFPCIRPIVLAQEHDTTVPEPPPIASIAGTVRACLAGTIGLHTSLMSCSRVPATRDPRQRWQDLTFVVAGTTIDHWSLIDSGLVLMTGTFQPHEAVGLVRTLQAALAFWPETWCLALTELWRAALRARRGIKHQCAGRANLSDRLRLSTSSPSAAGRYKRQAIEINETAFFTSDPQPTPR